MFSCKCIQLNMFNTKLLYMLKNCCFVIHGALWTLALFGPIFGQGEGYYIRSYYYILYPCIPLILTFLIYLICVSVFALIHRLHSYLFTSLSALMLLFIIGRLFVSPSSPRRMQFFKNYIYITSLKGGLHGSGLSLAFCRSPLHFYNYLHVCMFQA